MFSRTVKFYKESTGFWYIELPEWSGAKSDLQMVLGADTLLDIMAQGEAEVMVYFSTEPFNESNVLSWYAEGVDGDASHGGGMYKLSQYNGISYDLDMWLCDVTSFVFGGEMPDYIYFK